MPTRISGPIPRRRRYRAEVDERLAQGFIDLCLPLLRIEIEIVADAAPRAGGAGLHTVAIADDDCDAEPHQRPDIGDPPAIGPNDLHRLPDAAERSHDLPHLRVAAARVSVYFRQEPCFCPEIHETKRILLGVEAPVCPGRGRGENPRVTARYRPDSIGRAADRGLGQFGRVRITGSLTGNSPQTKPLRRIETRTLDPAVVERKALGLAVFEEKLTVIHSTQGLVDERLDAARVHARPFEKQRVGDGEIGHLQLHCGSASIWSQPTFRERRNFRDV